MPAAGQGGRGAAAGDQLVTQLDQAAGEVLQAGSCRTRTAGPSWGGSLLLSEKETDRLGVQPAFHGLDPLVEGRFGVARLNHHRLLGQDRAVVDGLGGDVHGAAA